MGILRATKYKTFLKLGVVVFLLSSMIFAGLIPPDVPLMYLLTLLVVESFGQPKP